MTHTLHRQGNEEELRNDYIVFTLAAQGFNDKGAIVKLIDNFKLLIEAGPVNYKGARNAGTGEILTGFTQNKMIKKASNKSYMTAVYTTKENMKKALEKLKGADNGMSVVVSGNFKEVFEVAKEVGLKPHTVHLSLGIYGKTELLPEKEILEITSMCGHGMVCPDRVEQMVGKVCSGKITVKKASVELSSSCTCGIFNPKRAEDVIKKICKKRGKIIK
ncbi:MAG: hypothetical protein GH148_02900 [Clostridia bacterium]|nr:hypothetical protein [Clostridia bacterium]